MSAIDFREPAGRSRRGRDRRSAAGGGARQPRTVPQAHQAQRPSLPVRRKGLRSHCAQQRPVKGTAKGQRAAVDANCHTLVSQLKHNTLDLRADRRGNVSPTPARPAARAPCSLLIPSMFLGSLPAGAGDVRPGQGQGRARGVRREPPDAEPAHPSDIQVDLRLSRPGRAGAAGPAARAVRINVNLEGQVDPGGAQQLPRRPYRRWGGLRPGVCIFPDRVTTSTSCPCSCSGCARAGSREPTRRSRPWGTTAAMAKAARQTRTSRFSSR